jgi:hypothetical protein
LQAQSGTECNRVQVVLAHDADLDELLSGAQLPQDFAAVCCLPMQARELTFEQQLQDVVSIALVVLSPPPGQPPDLGRIADPSLLQERHNLDALNFRVLNFRSLSTLQKLLIVELCS